MRIIAILLVAATCMQSCCKADCVDGALIASFENFRAVDIDTILLVKYQQGSQQQKIIDTTYRIRSTSPTDTFTIYHSEHLLYPFDWKIIIPALNKQYLVSDFQLKTFKCCGEKAKGVTAYKLNNVQQQGGFLQLR